MPVNQTYVPMSVLVESTDNGYLLTINQVRIAYFNYFLEAVAHGLAAIRRAPRYDPNMRSTT